MELAHNKALYKSTGFTCLLYQKWPKRPRGRKT